MELLGYIAVVGMAVFAVWLIVAMVRDYRNRTNDDQ